MIVPFLLFQIGDNFCYILSKSCITLEAKLLKTNIISFEDFMIYGPLFLGL